uniref:BHLH domain-containing protein n=1 Tax=Parascaris univalens TaxID=6257 RepID=A0A915B236_PARUN
MMSYQSPAKGRHSIANKLSCGHQKSPYQVQRRNERERRRVHQINQGYQLLSRTVPSAPSRKLSKLETLREAVRYIRYLQQVLEQTEERQMHSTTNTASLLMTNRLPSLDGADLFQYETHSTSSSSADNFRVQWKSPFSWNASDSCSTC